MLEEYVYCQTNTDTDCTALVAGPTRDVRQTPIVGSAHCPIACVAHVEKARGRLSQIDPVIAVSDPTDFEHALKNYIAIIVGYADLVLEAMPADDPRLPDVREIHKAATAAVTLLNNYRGFST